MYIGREHFVDIIGKEYKYIPLIIFVDGFGIYSNSYRTLIGMSIRLDLYF